MNRIERELTHLFILALAFSSINLARTLEHEINAQSQFSNFAYQSTKISIREILFRESNIRFILSDKSLEQENRLRRRHIIDFFAARTLMSKK